MCVCVCVLTAVVVGSPGDGVCREGLPASGDGAPARAGVLPGEGEGVPSPGAAGLQGAGGVQSPGGRLQR